MEHRERRDVSEITRLVRQAFGGGTYDFKPFIAYDAPMDTIRVLVQDRSVCEVTVGRYMNILNIFEINHPEVEGSVEYVGFSIEVISRVCRHFGLPEGGTVDVLAVLEKFEAESPDIVPHINEMRRLLGVVGQTTIDTRAAA